MDAQGKVSQENFDVDASGLSGVQISIHAEKLEMNDRRISSHTIEHLYRQIAAEPKNSSPREERMDLLKQVNFLVAAAYDAKSIQPFWI